MPKKKWRIFKNKEVRDNQLNLFVERVKEIVGPEELQSETPLPLEIGQGNRDEDFLKNLITKLDGTEDPEANDLKKRLEKMLPELCRYR